MSDPTTTAAQRVWVALHEEREFVGVFSTRDAAVQWANTRAGTWPNGKPRDRHADALATLAGSVRRAFIEGAR